MRAGEPQYFQLTYNSDTGDKPKPGSAVLVIDEPGQQPTRVPGKVDDTDPHKANISWLYTPQDTGHYTYHFEVTSAVGDTARFPDTGEMSFDSVSLVTKYIALIVGLILALGLLPFVVYIGARSLNRRGDPAAAARVALLIGVIASYGLYLILFLPIFSGWIMPVLIGIAALALLIVLFSRRR